MISMPASSESTFFFSGMIICPSGPIDRLGVRVLDLGLEVDVGLAAAEELAEHALEVLADGVERLLEAQAALGVDLVDQLLRAAA